MIMMMMMMMMMRTRTRKRRRTRCIEVLPARVMNAVMSFLPSFFARVGIFLFSFSFSPKNWLHFFSSGRSADFCKKNERIFDGIVRKQEEEEDVASSPPAATQEELVAMVRANKQVKYYEYGEDEDVLKQQDLKHLTKGCAIELPRFVVNAENDLASSEDNQLEASPITVYATEYQESNAMKIAANKTFCCYGIRNGLVRVLSRMSQSRSLLRGHEKPIASMSFLPYFKGEENVLATLSEDGTLFVRRLNEDESSETIKDSTLMKLDVSSEAAGVSGTTTLSATNDSLIVPSFCWVVVANAPNKNKAHFVVAYGNALFKSSVDLNEDAGGQSPIPFEERVDLDGPITSIDATQGIIPNSRIIVATTEKEILVYELEPRGLGFTKTAGYEKFPLENKVIIAARWLSEDMLAVATACINQDTDIKNYIECFRYSQKGYLVPGSYLEMTQSIGIEDSSECFWNSFQCVSVLYKNQTCFLFADSERNVVYALSVNISGEGWETFNYISQFSVSQPILSLVALDVSDEDDNVRSAQFGLFCMQTGAIQQLRLPMLDCVRLLPKGPDDPLSLEDVKITTDAPPQRAASPAVSPAVSGLLTPDMFMKSRSQSASAEDLTPSSPSMSNKPLSPVAQQQASKPAAASASTPVTTSTTTTTAGGTSGGDREVAKLLRELKNELKQEREKLRKERDQRDNAERELQKQLIALMSQATTKDLPTAISQIVSDQLGENAAAMQAALATNAAASQRAAVAAAKEVVQTTLQSEIRQAMQQVMIPAFERSTQNMFNQIANTFERSIGELNSELMQIRDQSVQANAMPLVQELQRTVNEIRNLPQSLDSALKSSVSNAFRGMGQQQQQQLGSPQGMFQQQNPPQSVGGGGVRSLADLEQQKLPPQAPVDPTVEIKRLLNTGNLEAAFSQALGTSNLEIVSWLCSQVASESVFGQHPCPLSPFVLLSLAQQLSSDLTTKDAERKLDWIRDTCLAIDPQDPALKLHVRPVLTSVYESLRRLGSSSQSISPSVKAAARLVVHVVNSLLSACP